MVLFSKSLYVFSLLQKRSYFKKELSLNEILFSSTIDLVNFQGKKRCHHLNIQVNCIFKYRIFPAAFGKLLALQSLEVESPASDKISVNEDSGLPE